MSALVRIWPASEADAGLWRLTRDVAALLAGLPWVLIGGQMVAIISAKERSYLRARTELLDPEHPAWRGIRGAQDGLLALAIMGEQKHNLAPARHSVAVGPRVDRHRFNVGVVSSTLASDHLGAPARLCGDGVAVSSHL